MTLDDDIAFACVDCVNVMSAVYKLLTDAAVKDKFTLIGVEKQVAELIAQCSEIHLTAQMRHSALLEQVY